jgi:hypothetical protein
VLAVFGEHPTPATLNRLAYEYFLKDELDGAWTAKPLELICEGGRTMLVLEDPGGEPLDRLVGTDGSEKLLAPRHRGGTYQVHHRDLVQKDLKPANILVNRATVQRRDVQLEDRCSLNGSP